MNFDWLGHIMCGTPLTDVFIIDEHAHMGALCGTFSRDASAEAILADMDSLGINISVVSHSMSLVSDYQLGNTACMEAVAKYPTRFMGYCTINPLYADETKDELARCLCVPGMVGIKLHPYCHNRPMSYKAYRPVYEYAARRRMPVMTHTYTAEDIEATDRLAAEYPDAVFIMAHMGGEGYNVEKALEVAAKHPNVYGDLAVSQTMEGRVEWWVKEIGAHKILFGTDNACMNPTATVALIAMANIRDDEKRAIFGLNMQKILDRIIP